jgi:tetratricopeptide (TPR) repeat protein
MMIRVTFRRLTCLSHLVSHTFILEKRANLSTSDGLGDILLTSRSKGLEGLGFVVTVPPMTDDEGTKLLLHEYSPSRLNAYQEKCSKIVQRLGGLPLAIDQAAAFIRYKQFPLDQLDDFLRLYDAQRKQVLRHTRRHFWKYGTVQIDGKEEENRAISAFTTWEMSFQRLGGDEARRRDIEHFLTVSAFLQPEQISESMFRHHWESSEAVPGWMKIFSDEGPAQDEYSPLSGPEEVWNSDPKGGQIDYEKSALDVEEGKMSIPRQGPWRPERFWELISRAHDLSLLDSIAGGATVAGVSFSLHPVICDWLQVREKVEPVRQYVCEAIKMVVDSVRQEDRAHSHLLRGRMILLGHINTCVEHDKRFSSEGQRLGQELESCEAAEWLALFYQDQGRYGIAEELLRQTFNTRRKTVGVEDSSTLTSMNNLAVALSDQGKYKEAEQMHRDILQVRERVLGKEHPDTLISMNNLALSLRHQGKYEEAEQMHREELQVTEKMLGKEHPSTLTSMGNLASALMDQGNYEEAEQMHREELQIWEKVLGKEHPDTLISMSNLALALWYQGKYEEAKQMHRDILQVREKVLGKEHPDTLTSMNNLALALSDQGKYEEAEQMHRDTLQVREKVLGKEHLDTLTSMNNLALALSDQGKYEEAEQMHREELQITERMLGKEHPSTLTSMDNLAVALSDQGKYEEAKQMHRDTLQAREKVLGKEHPDTLTSVSNLAYLLALRSRFVQAAIFYERAVAGYQRVLGPGHPTTIACAEQYSSLRNSLASKGLRTNS